VPEQKAKQEVKSKDEEINQPQSKTVTEHEESNVHTQDINVHELQHKLKRKTKSKGHALLKQKDEEIKSLKDQVLRWRADFDNYRKRMEKEKQDYMKYALEKVLLDLLSIMDSFDRALHPDNETEETKHFYEGFTLIYKQLLDFCAKQGVTEIEAVNKPFDPNLHQAVSQEKSEGVEPGTVIKEYQKGYMFHKRVLRPSMVVVAE